MNEIDEYLIIPADALPHVRVSPDGPYTAMDRYRDFLVVFGTDAGRRVFSQIVDLCEGTIVTLGSEALQSHASLAFLQGRRIVGQQIARWATEEPQEM